jgi:phytoene dehydrogenase-like protein
MDERVSAGRRVVIDFLTEATGDETFQDHIVGEKVIDPTEWRRRYGLRFGAAFGLSHGLDQLSLFRPSAEDETIEGLFFTGASTRPGNGVPLVMIGARLVAESIIERYSHYSRS